MQVEKLDHVNIITDKLAETAKFYSELLDLTDSDGAPGMPPDQVRWMLDDQNNALLHLNSSDYKRVYNRSVPDGADTGPIHHVALRCTDFDEMIRRLTERGADYKINDLSAYGLRQIFTSDPNNVLLELNYFDTPPAA